jgi:outer membrane immunogenic protein
MIRRILLSSAGALALTGAAFAADLPSRAPPPVFLPPPPMWTGFYIGINAGYDWAASRSAETTAFPAFAAPTWNTELNLSTALATGTPSVNPNGFIGGGQIGYNYQFYNSLVAGIEADIQGIAGSSVSGAFSGSGVPVGVPGETILSTVSTSKKTDYLGTVRGRIGYLFTPTLLIYGDGGLAYGGINSSTSIFQANTGTGVAPAFASFGRASSTQVGWTAGGGVEWMFLPNWSAKVEYLYYDLGKVTYNLSPLTFPNLGAPLYSSIPRTSTRFNGNVVRAGINYHFNWGAAPVVARY